MLRIVNTERNYNKLHKYIKQSIIRLDIAKLDQEIQRKIDYICKHDLNTDDTITINRSIEFNVSAFVTAGVLFEEV